MTVEQFAIWSLLALNCASNKHGIYLVLKIKTVWIILCSLSFCFTYSLFCFTLGNIWGKCNTNRLDVTCILYKPTSPRVVLLAYSSSFNYIHILCVHVHAMVCLWRMGDNLQGLGDLVFAEPFGYSYDCLVLGRL